MKSWVWRLLQVAIALTMTKASHVLSIFMFLEAKMSKFSYFLYHDHYLFAASPPSIHEFLEIQEMMNRRILSYRLRRGSIRIGRVEEFKFWWVRMMLSTSHSINFSEAFPIDIVSEFTRYRHEGILPYGTARAGFEPATLRSKDIDSTNVLPSPHNFKGLTNGN